MTADHLADLPHKIRRFEPPAGLAADANVTAATYEHATKNREAF